jgi:fructose-bisphosphate aldolase class I
MSVSYIDMNQTVQKLIAPYKGILAADESTPSITKRFANLGLTSTPELNKKYREMLFTTPDIEKYISGVILFDETIRQGLGEILKQKGIEIGIKVDQGLEDFNNTEEKITKGLDGLKERLEEYKKMGATFTKWRAVFKISDIYPSDNFMNENLNRLADYAKVVQESGLVPIVEPEVLIDGNHTNTRCEEITTKVLKKLFDILKEKKVDLSSLILKASMVIPGKESGVIVMPLEVSNSTLRTLQNSVPQDVPGIVFLSGGQTPDQATFNLNEINKLNKEKKFGNWELSFSFGRALQEEAMKEWNGKDENVVSAQNIFVQRMMKVSKSREGEL